MRTPSAVVLVEGDSDRMALHTLADQRGRNLTAEGIDVLAMGGITNTRAYALQYGPRGLGVRLAGIYDAPDETMLQNGLAAAGVSAALEPAGLPALGFYRCSVDLEDELIRALGVEAVEAVIEAAGETRSLRLLAGMPAQRGWRREAVLRRFLGVRSGRKARYAKLLVEALQPTVHPSLWLLYSPGSDRKCRLAGCQGCSPTRNRRPAKGVASASSGALAFARLGAGRTHPGVPLEFADRRHAQDDLPPRRLVFRCKRPAPPRELLGRPAGLGDDRPA